MFILLPRKPILALEGPFAVHAALSPSGLQFNYKEACEPISIFHVLGPSELEVARCPSLISEYKALACLLMTVKLICWLIFIPAQILDKGASKAWKLGFLRVKPSLASCKIIAFSVTTKRRIVVESPLKLKSKELVWIKTRKKIGKKVHSKDSLFFSQESYNYVKFPLMDQASR